MSFGGGLRQLLFRSKPAPDLDPVGYRLPSYLVASESSVSVPPAAPAPPSTRPAASMLLGPPQVHRMMTDGNVESLPADPAIESRAAYLVRSMIPPAPPPPPAP